MIGKMFHHKVGGMQWTVGTPRRTRILAIQWNRQGTLGAQSLPIQMISHSGPRPACSDPPLAVRCFTHEPMPIGTFSEQPAAAPHKAAPAALEAFGMLPE